MFYSFFEKISPLKRNKGFDWARLENKSFGECLMVDRRKFKMYGGDVEQALNLIVPILEDDRLFSDLKENPDKNWQYIDMATEYARYIAGIGLGHKLKELHIPFELNWYDKALAEEFEE